jgi:hypothetical protein
MTGCNDANKTSISDANDHDGVFCNPMRQIATFLYLRSLIHEKSPTPSCDGGLLNYAGT